MFLLEKILRNIFNMLLIIILPLKSYLMEKVHIGMKLVEQLLLEILKLKMGGLHFSRKMGERILMKN